MLDLSNFNTTLIDDVNNIFLNFNSDCKVTTSDYRINNVLFLN